MAYKNNKRSIITPIIIALSIVFGIFAGRMFNGQKSVITSSSDRQSHGKLDLIINMLDKSYVDTLDTKQMVEGVIPGLLKKLDPHTVYIPAKRFDVANEDLRGNFGGVGVQFIMHRDTVAVVKVVPNGPSFKAGLMDGDRIVKVNDTVIAGVKKKNTDIMDMMRGRIGSTVKLSIKRKGKKKLINKKIERGQIPLKSVDVAYMMDDEIAYIKVSKFAIDTYDEFVQGLDTLKHKGMKKLIVDLRGNQGGYLGNAINMINELLPNQKIIVYTEGKARARTDYLSNGNGKYQNLPVAVLIDEESASASEIFAGAIQDNDRGYIVGRRSFGKGLVQEQRRLPDGSALRITVSRYYTPSGRCIQKSYEEGKNNYYSEIYRRYAHGEFSERDSIHFNDSLKYKTTAGRTVYGGGGIMPDKFIPLDTSGMSNYLTKISKNALIYTFSFDYVDSHRDELKNMKDYKSILKYAKSKGLLNKLIKHAEKKGVKKDAKGYKVSKDIIETRLYAYFARHLIDDDGFYPIIRDIDITLNKAYDIIKEGKPLK